MLARQAMDHERLIREELKMELVKEGSLEALRAGKKRDRIARYEGAKIKRMESVERQAGEKRRGAEV